MPQLSLQKSGQTADGGAAATAPLLDLRRITKTFPGVRAVSEVDLTVRSRETLAVVGENGAGKSTLMKVIAGIYPAGSYTGEMLLEGRPCRFRSVREAEAAGIVLVPQELHVAPNLSIAENMFVGVLPGRWGWLDKSRLHAHTRERLAFFGIRARPEAPAAVLSPSEQRLMTIAAALSKSARLLILDEPTAALSEAETERLFAQLRLVREQGVGCLYITHRLDEIARVADRVAVMRNGEVVARFARADENRAEIVRAMIGREPERAPERRPNPQAEPVLSVTGLRVRDPRTTDRLWVDGANLTLHRGEILGLFGLIGAGRTELARAIFGAWPGAVEGEVTVAGRAGRPLSPREAIARGIGMLTEDRKQTGLIQGQSVLANISAASLAAVSGSGIIDAARERARNLDLARRLDLRPLRLDVPVDMFSGGNQQKILLARWLAISPRVLILDEPTLGVDVGARFELYRLIRDFADNGLGVLLISSDLTEVTDECDRLLVMYKGRITGVFGRDASRHAIMAAATGERG